MTLKEYFENHDDTPSRFASKSGLSRQMIYNYVKGASVPTIPVGLRIEELTGGKVTLYDWVKSEPTLVNLL